MSEEKRERIRKILGKYADMKPEDGETWESWYVAANDLMGQEIGIALEVADAAQPVARVPEDEADGYLVVSVKGLQELDTALDRADFKGYLPEDIAQAWYNLDWRSVAPQAPAVRVDLCDLRRRIAAAPRRQFESEKGVYTSWLDQGAVLDLLDAHIEKALAVIGFDRAQDGSECTVYGYVKEGVLHVDRIEQAPAASDDEDERELDAFVIDRMSKLLAEISLIIDGEPEPRKRRSYHDLPDKVRALQCEVELLRAEKAPAVSEEAQHIECLRRALFQARDAMRVMGNWVKKSDPAGYSWAVRMVDIANAALNDASHPTARAEGGEAELEEAKAILSQMLDDVGRASSLPSAVKARKFLAAARDAQAGKEEE